MEKVMSPTPSDEKGSLSEPPGTNDIDQRLWRKLDLHVVPVTVMMFFLSFIDRTNLGNARVAGLQNDLKLTDMQYTIALTVTFIPYILAELPSNLIMKRVGPHRLLPTMLTLWGLVTALQGIVSSYSGLLACRFLLGLFEGGLFPGLVLYLSAFYPRSKMHLRVAMFAVSSSIAGAFGGLLAYGIVQIRTSRLPSWAWIFVIEGAFSGAFGLASYFIMPSSPTACKFLSVEEKAYLDATLAEDRSSKHSQDDDAFSWREVGGTFLDVHVVLAGILAFLNGTILFSLAYFTPSIVEGLGHQGPNAQLMTVPPHAAAFFIALGSAYVSDKHHSRGLILIFCSVLSLIGLAMFLGSQATQIQYGALFFMMSGVSAFGPGIGAWMADNSAGYVRKATAIAICTMCTNLGGLLSPWLMGYLSSAPRYTEAIATFLGFSVAMVILSALNLLYLGWRNQGKNRIRQAMSRDEEKNGLGDKSAWYIYSL